MEVKPGYKQTEVGVIPDEWRIKQLKDMFDIKAGGDYQPKHSSLYENDEFRYPIYANALTNKGLYGFADYFTDDCNTITVTARGKLGYSVYRDHPYVSIGRLLTLHPHNIEVNGVFYAEYLNQFVNFIQESTGVPQLTSPQIGRVVVPLPPREEQDSISSMLTDTDTLITSLEKLIEKKKNIKQGMMQELLTGKRRLSGFSGKWKTKKLGDLANLYQPQTISQDVFSDDGYNVWGANGIIGKFNKYNHKNWQTTISCRGNCGTVNKTDCPCWITGNAMVVNVDHNQYVNKLFLYYKLSSMDFTDLVTGSGQPQIVRGPLAQLKLIIPEEIKEQRAISEVLSVLEQDIKSLEVIFQKYEYLKQGMMQELLTGRIRLI